MRSCGHCKIKCGRQRRAKEKAKEKKEENGESSAVFVQCKENQHERRERKRR